MIVDPVVSILREAAIRGRQLRLARERSGQTTSQSEDNLFEVLLTDQSVGITITPSSSDNFVDKERSA